MKKNSNHNGLDFINPDAKSREITILAKLLEEPLTSSSLAKAFKLTLDRISQLLQTKVGPGEMSQEAPNHPALFQQPNKEASKQH